MPFLGNFRKLIAIKTAKHDNSAVRHRGPSEISSTKSHTTFYDIIHTQQNVSYSQQHVPYDMFQKTGPLRHE